MPTPRRSVPGAAFYGSEPDHLLIKQLIFWRSRTVRATLPIRKGAPADVMPETEFVMRVRVRVEDMVSAGEAGGGESEGRA